MTSSSGNVEAAEADGSQSDVHGERFPRSARLRNGSELQHVVRQGRREPADGVDVFVTPSSLDRPRVGVIVPRHGHSSVERNRVRRRLREIARREWLPRAQRAEARLDLVFRARPAAYARSFAGLREPLIEVFEKLCSPA